jgi:REP element-mobilizing transposase RayT
MKKRRSILTPTKIAIIKVIKQKNANCCKKIAFYVKMMNILLNNVHENVKRMMSL